MVYTWYSSEVNNIEKELLNEIHRIMRDKELSQGDYAKHRNVSRQSVNPYLTGRKLLLTAIGSDLLEFLNVEIKLIPKEK
jgi:DNA-binding transcriptional regulator YiaG